MQSRLHKWNRHGRLVLWIIVLLAVAASLPLGASRYAMENTAKTVEYVFDYRDIVEVAERQPFPQQFLADKLALLKDAGVVSMSLNESTLTELQQAGRLVYYNGHEVSLLIGEPRLAEENFSYVLFNGEEEAEKLRPVVQAAMKQEGIGFKDWQFGGRSGMILEVPLNTAIYLKMGFDPLAMEQLDALGFGIVLRFSDYVLPYNKEDVSRQFEELTSAYNVRWILFNGDKAKGMNDNKEEKSLEHFADLMKKYNVGVAAIENIKRPQAGVETIAKLTDYNVARIYSLSPEDSLNMTNEAIVDRFQLAAKDRNIRLFFLNTQIRLNFDFDRYVHSIDKLAVALGGEEIAKRVKVDYTLTGDKLDVKQGIVERLEAAGFPPGVAQPFEKTPFAYESIAHKVVSVGAIALIALLVGTFVPVMLIPSFLIGLLGGAGLMVLKPHLLSQGLALGASIAAPTLALVWVMNRIRTRTVGDRRAVSAGGEWRMTGETSEGTSAFSGVNWTFAGIGGGQRLRLALSWFVVATVISLLCVPLIIGLLDHISYSLVLQQFRGVSALHVLPIVLVAIYVLFYNEKISIKRIKGLLTQPITLIWVLAAAVIGVVGMYYLSRTGNAGKVSGFEMIVRFLLEDTFGVRPRFKEFLLAHPLLLLGLFLSLRYRAAWLLVIVGSIGQLSMVDTFAHIHTPIYISAVRVLLGLGVGLIIGLALIGVWQIAEGVFKKWYPALKQKFTE